MESMRSICWSASFGKCMNRSCTLRGYALPAGSIAANTFFPESLFIPCSQSVSQSVRKSVRQSVSQCSVAANIPGTHHRRVQISPRFSPPCVLGPVAVGHYALGKPLYHSTTGVLPRSIYGRRKRLLVFFFFFGPLDGRGTAGCGTLVN
eukprot:2987428-Pyramimonas_sp.AAC.1